MNDQTGMDHGSGPKLLESMKNMMATSLALAQTRLELVTVELEAEVVRYSSLLVFAGSALFAFALAVLPCFLSSPFSGTPTA